jgi:hypothetical protein
MNIGSDTKSDAKKMGMLGDRGILFHPLVVATFFPIFVYAENTDADITIAEFIVPFAVVIFLTTLTLLLLRLVIKDSAKVSIIVSLLLLVFFTYGAISEVMTQSKISIAGESLSRHRYLMSASAIIVAAGSGVVLRFSWNLAPVMRAVAVGALILVLFNAGNIVASSVTGDGQNQGGGKNFQAAGRQSSVGETFPDIYYLILDGYSRADVLEEMGFTVLPQARSNYMETKYSLPSSLRMQYLSTDRPPLYRYDNNESLNFVQSKGYTYVHLGSADPYSRRNPYADIELLNDSPLKLLLSDYSFILMDSTILPYVALNLGIDRTAPFVAEDRKRFAETIEFLGQIPYMPGPTFTFNHMKPPHPPYIFDRDGNPPSVANYNILDPGNNGWASKPYTDQIFYLNKRIEEVASQILERSSMEPVIIIQGDHGSGRSWCNCPDDSIKGSLAEFERPAILNAYYLPEYCRSALYPSITPVNTFRMVFDACLGADFGLLEDKSYWTLGGAPMNFSEQSP